MTAKYAVRQLTARNGFKPDESVVLAADHDAKIRELMRALRWAGQWCPDLRNEECSPMPTKAVQRLIYGYTLQRSGDDK